LKSRKIETDLE